MYEREENKWSKGLSCVSQVLPVVLAVDTLQPGPLVATVCAVSGFGVAFSQTFHALAHTKTCDIPPPFRALQDAGIIVPFRFRVFLESAY